MQEAQGSPVTAIWDAHEALHNGFQACGTGWQWSHVFCSLHGERQVPCEWQVAAVCDLCHLNEDGSNIDIWMPG